MDYPVPKKIFIGVSWPYANGDIHLGHLAGQNIACDVFARYHRLKGHDILMVSGSDSHGAPVIFKAEELGVTPANLAQEYHEKIVNTFQKLGLVYENYTKTTTQNHKDVVQNIFNVLNEFGYLEIRTTEQYFDKKVNRFLPDRYVRGTCPNCKATNARGDECPECGAYLDAKDLINPYSTLSDSKPVLKKTDHYFMDLEKVEDEISKWVRNNNRRWRKWVREFTKGWIKQGLEPRAVTRDLSFGVPVPVKGWEEKVIYVWIEAVVGYLSAAIEWAQKQSDPSLWEEFWKNPECEHYYFIAGGNVPFHTIMWPAEITAYNKKYGTDKENLYRLPGEISSTPLNLPFDVPANKMLFFKGKKMSKGDSTGITIADLLAKYNPDLIRYFFVRYGPENHDREYIWKDFIDANNNELVANIGNFINRTLTFLYTKFDGVVPQGEIDEDVKAIIEDTFTKVGEFIQKSEFIKAAETILDLGRFSNKYFNDKQPWVTYKNEIGVAQNTIFNTIQLVNALRILLKPFTPFTVDKLSKILNISQDYDPTDEVSKLGRVSKFVDQWNFVKIESGAEINQPSILFEKLEYTEDLQKVDGNFKDKNAERVISFLQDKDLKDIPVATLVIDGINNKPSKKVEAWIQEKKKSILEGNILPVNKYNSGYVKLHDSFSKIKGIKSSTEELTTELLEKKNFPKINSFVDIYNIISVITGISFGAHDTSKIIGNVSLKLLSESDSFIPIGEKDPQIISSGEYVYTDDQGVICRLDIKQCERTKVTPKTKSVFIIAQGPKGVKVEEVEKALNLLKESIQELIAVKA